MNSKSLKRIKDLQNFREHQRDAAAADMNLAREKIEQARQRKQDADRALEEELESFRSKVGQSMDPYEMESAKQMAIVAKNDVDQRQSALNHANAKGEEKHSILLESHVKVKQMELLQKNTAARLKKEAHSDEQKTVDDLVNTKKAFK